MPPSSAPFTTARSRHAPARLYVVLALAFAAALAGELFGARLLATIEARTADIYLQRHAGNYSADPSIVIIDIDDASMRGMQKIAGLWSWPREIHADLIEALAEFSPRAIIFDVAFSEQDLKRPKSDARLSEVIAATPQVYVSAMQVPASPSLVPVRPDLLAKAFGISAAPRAPAARPATVQLPMAIEPAAWRLGLINRLEDGDGVLRRYRLYAEDGGMRLPSLPARVAAASGAVLPDGADFRLRWPARGHRRIPYGDVYKLLTEERPAMREAEVEVLAGMFRNKLIVVGASAASSFDHHLTPLGAGYPGVDVLAVALDNLISGRSLRTGSPFGPFLLGAALLLFVSWSFARRLNPVATGAALLAVSAAALALADQMVERNLLLPVATPLIFAWTWFVCAALAGYLRERRTREQAVSLFRRFLNPNVVQQIVEQGETVESLSGQERKITVLFSDIRGFTTLSEQRSPQEVVALLNRYFERQVEVIFRHGGTLDKFIGDCIMAFWGAPVDDAAHASRAIAAALDMERVLLEFRQMLIDEGSDVGDFDVGIGIHTGPAVVGFIGAPQKLDYTAIGDTVNLASRVEGLTKGVARVLVTRETMEAAEGGQGDVPAFVRRGNFEVKGRAARVELYEPRRST
ncbi:adenylate/guanylate cyclase domain-containing protein [Noviherbaspirillum galbum]|uniref:Adenylate/guanylate cyclase domain-containing protein n=1 Tax=Noviherbaspirillum galbum TaxID=2709383 RepID=A0A6B3SQL0_9BURK|nr:adenylate/guanylate cyclase domain-containing protein [Noviherbaspirillum galbum]NEX62931.1 adenylate/guanylate cyclase domain-containing protein [Noviherbaspirillum galbum]